MVAPNKSNTFSYCIMKDPVIQPECRHLTPESTAPNLREGVAQNPAQHVAVGSETVRHDVETDQASILSDLTQVLENKEHEGGKGQEVESRVNCLDCQHRENCTDNGCRWIRTIDLSLIRES